MRRKRRISQDSITRGYPLPEHGYLHQLFVELASQIDRPAIDRVALEPFQLRPG